jgi:hypothetical protein
VATRHIRAAFRAFNVELPDATVKGFNGDLKSFTAVLRDAQDLNIC